MKQLGKDMRKQSTDQIWNDITPPVWPHVRDRVWQQASDPIWVRVGVHIQTIQDHIKRHIDERTSK